MAQLLFKSGKRLTVSHEKALAIWEIKQGKPAGNDKQQAYCESVQMVFLNRHKAPKAYTDNHKLLFDEMDGVTRPNPGVIISRKDWN